MVDLSGFDKIKNLNAPLHSKKIAIGKLTITNKMLGVWCSSRKGADMGQLEKKCIGCGKTFTVSAKNQVYCTVECRENERRKRHAEMYKKRKRQKKVSKVKEKKEVHMGEIATFNDKAKQMGLTYGQYMIFLQAEKDREERAKIS